MQAAKQLLLGPQPSKAGGQWAALERQACNFGPVACVGGVLGKCIGAPLPKIRREYVPYSFGSQYKSLLFSRCEEGCSDSTQFQRFVRTPPPPKTNPWMNSLFIWMTTEPMSDKTGNFDGILKCNLGSLFTFQFQWYCFPKSKHSTTWLPAQSSHGCL